MELQEGAALTRLSSDQVAWARCTIRTVDNGGSLLQIEIHWAPELACSESELSLLDIYLPSEHAESSEPWSPKDFYNNVHVPPADLEVPPAIQSERMASQLYPFQRRAVHWLLEREGAVFENGRLVTRPSSEVLRRQLPISFYATKDARGVECFVSKLYNVVVENPWSLLEYNHDILGGILAEEMGLGKTVELAALVCLHQRPPTSTPRKDGLVASPSTLIITPPHILSQWQSELATHAPDLNVLYYKGMAAAKRSENEQYTVDDLLRYDIVLTTYATLAREIHFTTDPPERSRRFEKQHRSCKSPLVLINWWRVCLDEAQMVESGVSKAAKVAQIIPRINAWTVSGTPVKRNLEDLLGLLVFLKLEPFCSSKKMWQRLNKRDLHQIFSRLAIRHNKHSIAHELRIPRQRRSVIVMPFTAIEEQYYAEIFQEMCTRLHLKSNGDPESDQYNPETMTDDMRDWLRQLRETCLHPLVGVRNRNALGSRRAPLRTVGEVLETMIEQNETQLRHEECEIVASRTLEAHIVANNKANMNRSKDALQLYTVALSEATQYVDQCRTELDLAKAKDSTSKRDRPEQSLESDHEEEDGSTPNARPNAMKKLLHAALGVQQVCAFFVATSYYQIKENDAITVKDSEEYQRLEELEKTFYDQAKAIRKEMLQENHAKALKAMQKLKKDTGSVLLPRIPTLDMSGGIENRKLLEKMDNISELLDEQAGWIEKWRAKILDILTRPLVDQDDGIDITGDEYEESTKVQDELPIYTLALRAMIADRHRLITGETNFLIEGDQQTPNEMKHKRSDGEVVYAIKRAEKGKDHDPKLTLELLNLRNKIKPKKDDESLKHLLHESRRVATNLQWSAGQTSVQRANVEISMIEKLLKDIQQISKTQEKALKLLKTEQEAFRTCMNLRVAYYKQVQVISDTVTPWREELDKALDVTALEKQAKAQENTENRLSTLRTKRRFLLHLRENSNQEQDRMCTICRDKFENGVLTVCGHTYCKDCIIMWFKSHRTCPECRTRLRITDFHDITYRPQGIVAHEEPNLTASPTSYRRESSTVVTSPGSSSATTSSAIYSDMNSTTMNEIKSIELSISYGTKIDTIARHLLWLRANDPGAKSIVFSQYADFLSTLAAALTKFGIGHVSIRTTKGIDRFRKDPAKEVFLLDAKSDSSGLNLVNATHVFLCEPLINAAIELQAIARVHRIGQLRETRVYMYLISDTVEEAIYDISVSRRLAHIGSSSNSRVETTSSSRASRATTPHAGDRKEILELALDEANNMEIQQAPMSKLLVKGKSGGEFVDREDLWNCLFGKNRARTSHLAGLQEGDRELIAGAAEHRREVERVRNAAIEERLTTGQS